MNDEIFMARALDLARSVPFTSPNPMVGCVIARDGRIIGEGAHRGSGTPHAEAIALEGVDASGATLYVTLEPCTHHGRTPPCAPVVASSGVTRVVVAQTDPDVRVSGRGIALLREAGIGVEVGLLGDEAAALNAAYLHHRRTGRACLTLKLATSLDGAMAAADGSSRWITSDATRQKVHERRSQADAVMVGVGTVLADDPALTARHLEGARNPLRIVADASGRTPPTARLFSEPGDVLIATTERCPHETQLVFKQAGAEVVVLPPAPGGQGIDVDPLLELLGERGLLEVYCEGGPTLATSLLREGKVDRLEIHYGPLLVGGEGLRLGDLGVSTLASAQRWKPVASERCRDDLIVKLERR